MATTKIDVTKPSIELDALVAEHVFGIEVVWTPHPESDKYPPQPRSKATGHGIALYASCIEDAWRVVEKMRAGCWVFELAADDYGPTWYCTMMSRSRNLREVTAESKSAPHAICLAALLALGVIQ